MSSYNPHHEVWEAHDDPSEGAAVGQDSVWRNDLLVKSGAQVLVGKLLTGHHLGNRLLR